MSWKVITSDTFMNQEKVFPAAQPSVLRIIQNARKFPEVKKIIVFGSCTESRFSPVSDIDIFVEQDSAERFLLAKGLERGVDYWTRSTCDEKLLQEIETKGVVVYEQ